MKSLRSKKTQLAYDRYRKTVPEDAPCTFCSLQDGDEQIVSVTEHFKVIYNLFPYSNWDSNKVAEHLMIVPKKHTDTLKELSFLESKEYFELLSIYEHDGFNIYARTPSSNTKTIVHQHTHLIKSEPKSATRNALKNKLRLRKR